MRIFLLLIILIYSSVTWTQPPINERYDLPENYTVFGSVIATDSMYYVTAGTDYSIYDWDGILARYNLDGTENSLSIYDSDTLGYDFWDKTDLIRTNDGNFAMISTSSSQNRSFFFTLFKFNPLGDTIFTRPIHSIFDTSNYHVSRCPDLIQLPEDSSYTCLLTLSDTLLHTADILLINLSKIGEINWYKIYTAPNPNGYRLLIPRGLVRKPDNGYVISSYMYNTYGPNIDERSHIRLIEVDSIGEVDLTYTNWSDIRNIGGDGLTQTINGGYLHTQLNGFWNASSNGWRFKSEIIKLNSNFEEDWTIDLGGISGYSDLSEILALNDSQFVMVGNFLDVPNQSEPARLVKFDINGNVIWDRFYVKVPNLPNHSWNFHTLYDVDMTLDSGFVMVGQSKNYHNPNHPLGQLGWLVKTDKYGCLIPDCHLLDDTTTVDTTDTVQPPQPELGIMVYPNPASDELFVYYGSENFTSTSQVLIYNSLGQITKEWSLNLNYTTYMLDVSNLSSGVYVLKVLEQDNNLFLKKIFIK